MQSKKRVALFVEAHEGLGHFNVVRQLAEDLLSQDEATEVMILSGTMQRLQADLLFSYDRCRIVYLPLVDLTLGDEGKLEYTTPSGSTYLKDENAIRERMEVIKENLALFEPDAVVFEFYPFRQSFREPDMLAVQEYDRNILKICLCRDIIHSRDTAGTLKRLQAFDYVIVRGDDSTIKLSDSQQAWADINIPVLYLGYFASEQPFRKLHASHTDPILVFAGGGFHIDDIDFFQSIIAARKHDSTLQNRDLLIYLSPNSKKHILKSQGCSAYDFICSMTMNDESVKIMEPADHKAFCKAIANAALVITHGGYNTSLETLLIGTPLMIIPRFTISDPEQKMRAGILSRLGVATVLLDDTLKPDAVSRGIVQAIRSFQADNITRKPLKIDGSRNSAQFILNWIERH